MKTWVRHWPIYLPAAAVLLFGAGFVVTLVVQSQYPEIKVADQEVVGGRVTIDKAFLPINGFVAIHASDADGGLDRSLSIGHAALESGLNLDVVIRLLQPVEGGTKLFAVIHRDSGADERYEFNQGAAGKDPILMVGGKPAAVAFFVG